MRRRSTGVKSWGETTGPSIIKEAKTALGQFLRCTEVLGQEEEAIRLDDQEEEETRAVRRWKGGRKTRQISRPGSTQTKTQERLICRSSARLTIRVPPTGRSKKKKTHRGRQETAQKRAKCVQEGA